MLLMLGARSSGNNLLNNSPRTTPVDKSKALSVKLENYKK